jgi:hypothetical protein
MLEWEGTEVVPMRWTAPVQFLGTRSYYCGSLLFGFKDWYYYKKKTNFVNIILWAGLVLSKVASGGEIGYPMSL